MPSNLKVDLKGRVALVTGAGRGLGRLYAEELAAAGAAVAVNDLSDEACAPVVAVLAAKGVKAAAVPADISNEGAVNRMFADARKVLGPVEILINNAAMYAGIPRRRFDAIPIDEWRAVMDVNITGSYLCARAALPHMLERRWGRIVNVSSSTVPLGRPGFVHYVTSKAAILGMTRTIARELGKENITVNCVMPGLTETEGSAVSTNDTIWEMVLRGQAIPRREQPEDVVGAVMFLLSDAASFITGQTICIDGGSAHV